MGQQYGQRKSSVHHLLLAGPPGLSPGKENAAQNWAANIGVSVSPEFHEALESSFVEFEAVPLQKRLPPCPIPGLERLGDEDELSHGPAEAVKTIEREVAHAETHGVKMIQRVVYL